MEGWLKATTNLLKIGKTYENIKEIRWVKGNFSEILKKYHLKRKYAHNFRKFQVCYIFFITEIFQNFVNILRKSEKLKKRKNIYKAPLSSNPRHCIMAPSPPPSHYNPLPHHPVHNNDNLSACEWKASCLRHTVTVSLIVHTAPSLPAPYHLLMSQFSLRSSFLTWYSTLRF